MNDEFSLEDIMIILQRRLLYFLLPVLVVAPVGLMVIMLLPPIYRAEGKILVESQQISEQLIQSTISNQQAIERIQTISARVTTRNRLLEVADKYGLFPREMNLSDSEKVARMRRDFDVDIITSGNRNNRRRNQDNTLAFKVAFSHREPDKAFQVANEFMTLFLSEDVRSRAEGASTATEFFRQEKERIAGTIDQLDDRIADYKAKNADALPDDLALHRQMLVRAQEDLGRTQSAITVLLEEIRSLETQLSTYLAGSGVDGPAQEIARLKAQLAGLLADKTDSHPDVRALRAQISVLERQLAPSMAIQTMRRELQIADQALRDARKSPDANPAEVERLRDIADTARERLSTQISQEAASGSADFMLAQLQGRVDMSNSRLASLEDQAETYRETIAQMEDRIARTPSVERGLVALTRDRASLDTEYQALLRKQQAAELSENLEDDQKAEKFSILESANRPETPFSPKRAQLSVLVIAAALALGALFAGAVELFLDTLRGRKHLTSLGDEPPIAVIPYIQTANDRRMRLPFKTGSRSPRPPSRKAA